MAEKGADRDPAGTGERPARPRSEEARARGKAFPPIMIKKARKENHRLPLSIRRGTVVLWRMNPLPEKSLAF